MNKEGKRTPTGIVGLDYLLQGGYPRGRIILEGPSSQEKNAFALSFAADGLRNDDCVIVVTSTIPPAEIKEILMGLGVDAGEYERNGRFVILDWYSHTHSPILEVEEIGPVIRSPGNLFHLNEAFSKALLKFPKEASVRAVVDGLSFVITSYDADSALLLADSIATALTPSQTTVLFLLDSRMHDRATISFLEKNFDGSMELRRIKLEGKTRAELSIHSLRDTKLPAGNFLLKSRDGKGLLVESGGYVEDEGNGDEISLLMSSLQKDPGDEDSWFELGTHYASEGEYEKALECFDTAIRINPNCLAAWTSKANICIEQGRRDEALLCYKKALESQPDADEEEDESEEDEEKEGNLVCQECGTEINPGDPFCLGCGADIPPEPHKKKEESVREVLAICEERIRKNPEDVDAWFMKGLCLARIGRYKESIDALNQATRLDLEYPGLWFIKGKLYSKLGDEKKATLSIKRAIEFAQKETDRRVGTFECSICGRSVELSANQCPNCGARFVMEERKTKPEEKELVSLREDMSMEAVLQKWETELADLVSEGGGLSAIAPRPKRVKRVKKKILRKGVGLTNGLAGEKRGARSTKGIGLTNGKGRTNGLMNGLVNGLRRRMEGRVNGRPGRTNGLTNGVRGKTNGLRKREEGLTNGLVNGSGRAVGITNGLVNGIKELRFSLGDGLTNGNGLTNGFGVRRFSREVKLARWKIFLIPLVAFVLLTLPFFYVTSPIYREYLTVDGEFGDWDRVLVTQMNPSNVAPNADIIQGSVDMGPRNVFFYLEVSGILLQGNPLTEVGDVVHILIDSDRDYETGYRLRGLGADFLIEVSGIDREVFSSSLWKFKNDGSQHDWSGWTAIGHARVALGISEMEVSVARVMLGKDVDSMLVLFHTLSWSGEEDFSDYILSEGGGVLSVRQRSALISDVVSGSAQNLLNVELSAYNKAISVHSLQLDILGSVKMSEIGSVELVKEGGQLLDSAVFSGNPVTFEFTQVLIEEGSTANFVVRADLAGIEGNTIGAVIPSASSVNIGRDAPTLTYISSIRDLGYVGTLPEGTRVDGGFHDWVDCSNPDSIGEESLQSDPNIDIMCYDKKVSQQYLFIYFDVAGRILAGTNVPDRSPTIRQYVPSPVIDSDGDTVPDQYDFHKYDFNNDGIADVQTPNDVDYDGLLDYPYGTDYWLNTTIPSTFPPPYAGRNVTRYIGPVEKPVVIGEDVARVFVDSDNSTSTGYAYGGMGADYMLEIRGIEGRITRAGFLEFDGSFPGEWRWKESNVLVDAASDSRRLESSIDISSLRLQPDYEIAFETRNWKGGRDDSRDSESRSSRGNIFLPYLPSDEGGGVLKDYENEGIGLETLPEDGHYSYLSSGGLLNAYFTSRSNQSDQVRIERGDLVLSSQVLSLGYNSSGHYKVLAVAANSTGVVSGNRIRYVDFVPGMSDEYHVEWDRVKHDIVVGSASAIDFVRGYSGFLSISCRLTLPLSAELWADGVKIGSHFSTESSIYIVDRTGESLVLKPPYAYEMENYSDTVSGRFSGRINGSAVYLHMEIPISWLRSENRQYPVIIDPTVTVETTSDSEPTRYSNQRKVIYDGSYYWAFYGNTTAKGIVYEYSSDGQTWSGTPVAVFSTNGLYSASVWHHDTGSQKLVYAVSGDENSVYAIVRKGTISGTTISWGNEYKVQVCGSGKPLDSKVSFISRSSDGYIWVVSGQKESATSPYYNLAAVRSTNVDDLSAWDPRTLLWSSNIENFYIYPMILPLSGGDMYAIWYADGEIAGKLYESGTGWASGIDYIENTTTGVSTKPPSAVVDSSSNIHLIYSNLSGAINYTKYTTSWGSPTVLNSTSDNSYPTISLESTNDYLYAFWVNSSNQVIGSKWEGSDWSNITSIDANTTAKTHLTSIYSTPKNWNICWECGAGTGDPYDVRFSCIPEFNSLLLPLALVAMCSLLIVWNRRRKRGSLLSSSGIEFHDHIPPDD